MEANKDKKKKTLAVNSIQNMMSEAYEESDRRTPILFLITHSVNVY